MQEHVRVDLIFPRSGQILPVYVPDAMVKWVARRNFEIFLSLSDKDAPSVRAECNRMHLYPS
jgi:hypothetical protein